VKRSSCTAGYVVTVQGIDGLEQTGPLRIVNLYQRLSNWAKTLLMQTAWPPGGPPQGVNGYVMFQVINVSIVQFLTLCWTLQLILWGSASLLAWDLELDRLSAVPAVVTPMGYMGAVEPETAGEIFGQDIRETPWRTAQEQAAGFHLPPGFVVELIASEPQIDKPMNMAFDYRGRLWVTCTLEYPVPVQGDAEGRDSIKILEDTNGDGRFDSVTTFADGLNIPIGLLPYGDGVICFSIPHLWYLRDTTGDGRADERTVLLGPFDTTRDTHGMVNSLRMGLDGWVYACHGFSNRSDVTARDGSRVQLTSGNVFRFRPDGSTIERFTTGQVNPFGMTQDQWGNWYTADCHSKPLTALLAGACYPSFGRPHDGLGFAPSMMEHLHGSTAIAGVEYYQADQFPEPYRQLFYSGNVMTCRINCNRPVRTGMTVTAEELPDFMTSDDPWFRPVDVRLGPDGCLYVADFYNKIIGHYEVPLNHPGRDRTSGRIWRIRYAGGQLDRAVSSPVFPIETDPLVQIGSTNFQVRRQGIEAIRQSGLQPNIDWAAMALDRDRPLSQRQSVIEVMGRSGQLTGRILWNLFDENTAEIIALILRLACGSEEMLPSQDLLLGKAQALLQHGEPEVVRGAIEFLGRWGDERFLITLARIAADTEPGDPVRKMAARIAIRDILQRHPGHLRSLMQQWEVDSAWRDTDESRLIVGVLPGVSDSGASAALLRYLAFSGDQASPELTSAAIDHASQFPSDSILDLTLTAIDRLSGSDIVERVKRLVQVAEAFSTATPSNRQQIMQMAARTQSELLDQLQSSFEVEGGSGVWIDQRGDSWQQEMRLDTQGRQRRVLSSLTRGEQYTGTLSSESFDCPGHLSFWMCGHNGFPDQTDHRKNRVRLVMADTERVLIQAYPPRSDVAHQVNWDLSEHAGQSVKLQVIDEDSANAFAWLAVGDFSFTFLQTGRVNGYLTLLGDMARKGLVDKSLDDRLRLMPLSPRQRAVFTTAFYQGKGQHLMATLARQALSAGRPDLVLTLREQSGRRDGESSKAIAQELARSMTGAEQSSLARALLGSTEGCELLAEMLDQGWLHPISLRGAATLLPETLGQEQRQQLQEYFSESEQAGLDTAYVARRLSELDWSVAQASRGHQLFRQLCISCHQLRGEGVTVGPQLDGAVHRGIERLAEDILLPNLNVERDFRVSTFLLEDGSIVSGQIQQEDEQSIRMIGSDAQSFTVETADVIQRKEAEQSLMPANFGELLDGKQLADLLQFLVESSSQRPKP
jgi:putative heme-binding domain-containing protein